MGLAILEPLFMISSWGVIIICHLLEKLQDVHFYIRRSSIANTKKEKTPLSILQYMEWRNLTVSEAFPGPHLNRTWLRSERRWEKTSLKNEGETNRL